MFRKKTVFVIGAGASWHYGYPTGEALIRKVIIASQTVAALFTTSNFLHYDFGRFHCGQLAEKLAQLNPLVIDYFLGHNESLRSVGRFMIAWVLFQCETEYARLDYNPNRIFTATSRPKSKHDDDWYRFLLHRMTFDLKEANQLLNNNVHFITFNYDTSLDHHLYRTLSQIELLQKDNVVEKFMTDRVIHMYGSLRSTPVRDITLVDPSFESKFSDQVNWESVQSTLNMIYDAAKNLKVIDPHDKEDSEPEIIRAQELMRDAEVVYFLGFGFDPNNCRRLGLNRFVRRGVEKPHVVLLTNFCDSGRVNKDAARAFFGSPAFRLFERDEHLPRFDKSIRDVYDAFALDFGSPEQD